MAIERNRRRNLAILKNSNSRSHVRPARIESNSGGTSSAPMPQYKLVPDLRDDNDESVDEAFPMYFPSTSIALKVVLCATFTSVVWMHISDCDEVFNYWEPSHYLIYGKGFQTWEYAPQYALRSYFYLMLHVVPTYLYAKFLHPSRILVFYFIRSVFAVICSIFGVYYYKSVCREFGVNIGRITLVFMVFSPGMFIASTAFLPSTFSMYMTMMSIGSWFQRRYELAIFSTAISVILSWPFAAIIGLPIALDVIFGLRKTSMLIRWGAISAACTLLPMLEFDSVYYGRFVFAPWNIIRYNIFSSHGPNLYGVEPWYFYFLNGFLNFNIAFILAIATPFLLFCVHIFIGNKIQYPESFPYEFSLSSFYLWFIVFCLQPHKEERFLFPVYPLICLCAAVSVDALQMLWYRFLVNDGDHYVRCTIRYVICLLSIFCILGTSRIIALYKGYHAPLDTYIELFRLDPMITANNINICAGKEWHRYPSSFFLPSNRYNFHFLKSDFNGQLPGEFIREPGGTKVIRSDLNDLNVEEPSHYVDIDICDLLVDLDTGGSTPSEPNYSQHSNWTLINSIPFLDSSKTSRFIRTFYIPVLWEMKAHFASYNLLQRKSFKLFKEFDK